MMKANTPAERLYNGIIKENPTFVLMLGMCPTLAVTTSAFNGIGMGLTTTVILAASNLMISLLRKFIPDKVVITMGTNLCYWDDKVKYVAGFFEKLPTVYGDTPILIITPLWRADYPDLFGR